MATIVNIATKKSKLTVSPLKSPAGGTITVTGPNVKSVTGITRVLTVATATITTHGWYTGDTIVFAGADQAGYNLSTTITVVDVNTVTYTVNGSTVTPATGTITATKTVTRNIASLTASGETGTFTSAAHGFTTGATVTVAGATPSIYNGSKVITVSNANVFTADYSSGIDTVAELRTAIDTLMTSGTHGWAIHDAAAGANAKVYSRSLPTIATAGYQIATFGVSKAGGDPTGLTNNIAATSGRQDVGVGGNKVGGSATGLANTVAATAGYQVVNVGGAKVGGDPSGLANDATVYTATITVDGVAKPISVTGSAAQTYTTVLSEINTDLGASATAAIVGGNIRVTSATTGASSTVAIVDVDLFATLTGYVAVLAAVPGAAASDTTYTATITVDGVAKPISLIGSAAQTYTTLLAELNTDLGASAVASLSGGNIRVTSATTGTSSTVATVDGTLFAALTGFTAIASAVAGTNIVITTYTATITVDGVAKPISIAGGSAQTFTTLLSEINTDLGASATAAIVGGNIKITSATVGTSSSVLAVTGTLFTAVTDFSAITAAVAGTGSAVATAGYDTINVHVGVLAADATGLASGTTYTASISVDGTPNAISVVGAAAQTYTALLSEINTDLSGATATLSGNTIKVTSSSTGATSAIVITDTTLFKSLKNFNGNNVGVGGTATTHYVKIDLNTSGKVIVSEYAGWDAGAHTGSGEFVASRQTITLGDRPGSFYVFTFPTPAKGLAVFR